MRRDITHNNVSPRRKTDKDVSSFNLVRRDGRVVECGGLENR